MAWSSASKILVMSLSLVRIFLFANANPVVDPSSAIDPTNPSLSNPSSPILPLSFPANRSEDPFPSGIPTQPDVCDGQNPSDDCFHALSAGYLWFDKNSECSDLEKDQLGEAVWDASYLASYSSNFPNNGFGLRGGITAEYYIGPDYSQLQNRIAGNFKRVAGFQMDVTSGRVYITVSCKDTKDMCWKKPGGLSIGGYAWTDTSFWGYYHYITLCPIFFNTNSLDTVRSQVGKELASGDASMATNLDKLRSMGSFFLHEMMHTRIADGGIEPHIGDQLTRYKRDGGNIMAYGAWNVHRLATYPKAIGGGVYRSSINADSYAMLANAALMWDTTGYFPAAYPKNRDSPPELIFPEVILGEVSDLASLDLDGLFEKALQKYKPNKQPSVTFKAPASATPSPTYVDPCGDWYTFGTDNFEIYGNNFDAAMMGIDGSGIKAVIDACGTVTFWEFELLANDPNEFQWFAKGHLPTAAQTCAWQAVERVVSSYDGCPGHGG